MPNNSYKSYKKEVIQSIKKATEETLMAIGLFVEGEAKLRCPVGKYPKGSGRVGGNLRASIDHKVEEQEQAVHIGSNVEYAPYVEKGTSKMKAQPYLEPAIIENKDKIKAIVEKELSDL